MSEPPNPPAASSSHPSVAAGASAVSSNPAHTVASSPGIVRPEKPALSARGATSLWILGIVLPAVTLLLEVGWHLCAGVELFDPIPTWWHVALIALVPAVNFATWRAIRGNRSRWFVPLAHGNAIAIGVGGVYTVMFLPLTPFAVIGILFGVGLLALAPLLSFIALLSARGALRRAHSPLPRIWPGLIAGVLALVAPEAHRFATGEMLSLAVSGDAAKSRRGVQMLRWAGSRAELLRTCYGVNGWETFFSNLTGWRRADRVTAEAAQEAYYRVTGDAFNAVPAPVSATVGGRGRGRRNFDPALGGTRVAGKVPGLSMTSSRFDGKIETAAGTSYTEWTIVFKNVAANQSEARAQIELPPGAVVSRLTLWIDGEPREAAFGGRAQVRQAYQEVAVQQRRDPVLVTTAGPDQVLVQCFPVPPNGGEMKVRMGITAPLRLPGRDSAEAILPRFLETNFDQAASVAHDLWLESDRPFAGSTATIKRQLSQAELAQAPRWVLPGIDGAAVQWAEDPTDPQFAIRQSARPVALPRPSRVAFVIDGSKSMAGELPAIAEHLRKMPAGIEFSVVFAGDEPEVLAAGHDGAAAAAWLRSRDAKGGRDNLAALEQAWDLVAQEAGGAIVWLHGPQPVLLGNIERLLQRTERASMPPDLFDLTSGAAPNRVLERLDQFRRVHPLRVGGGVATNLAHLFAQWRGEAPPLQFVRERVARADAPEAAIETRRHVAGLWAAEEVERLLAAGTKEARDRAAKLAVRLQLVTPVSGAVVLERQEQYDRHGLTPADPDTVPTIPEPGTALLLALGAGALLLQRRRTGAAGSEKSAA